MSADKFRVGTPVLIFLLLALTTTGLGAFVFLQQEKHLKNSAQTELNTIVDLKAEQIDRWRRERRGDVQVASQDYFFASAVARWAQEGSPSDERRQFILDRLTDLQKAYDYQDVALLDEQGAVRLSASGALPALRPSDLQHVADAVRTDTIRFSDLYRAEGFAGAPIRLDFFAPLSDRSGGAVGVLLFRIDPDRFLFPLIQSWPTPSATGETLLVERVGDDVLFLNELRHRKNTALTLYRPVTDADLPAALAGRGYEGLTEGVDYRGIPVLAGIRKIADSPWILIAKIDQQEVYASVRELTQRISGAILVFNVLTGLLILMWWRQQRARWLLREYQDRLERKALLQHFDYLSKYANDVIVLCDSQFRIVELNDRALEAYGYTREELLGRCVDLFQAPSAFEHFEGIREQILERRSLMFETLHQSKDGTVFPVEISARVIETEGKTYYQGIIRDISERKQAEQALRAERQRLYDVLETLPVMICLLTPDYHVAFANRSFRDRFGESEGRPCYEYVWKFPEPCEFCESFKVLETGKPHFWQVTSPDGKVIDAYDFPFTDVDGSPLVLEMDIDVTVQKRAEAEIKRLNAELEQRVVARTAELEAANHELEAFSYSVSHDLRTPLRAIDGFSNMLVKRYAERLDDEGKRLIQVVRGNTVRMSRLIDDILAFSRAGRLELTASDVDMDALVREAWQELESARAGRDVRLAVKQLAPVRGDTAALRQVWINLLVNAVKFTRSRDIAQIEVGSLVEENDCTYYVKDNGVGFEQAYVHKLFGVFQRLHGVDEFEGTGIGLAIIKRIVVRHGGHVWAEGKVDEGATIYFTLPRKET